MKQICKIMLVIALVMLQVLAVPSALNAQSIAPDGAVSALSIDGDRIYVGQGSLLFEGHISDRVITFTQKTDLHRHTIRGITTTSQRNLLVLTEDGVTLIGPSGQAIDFLQGGGQNMAASGNLIYVAALDAGVRVLKINEKGKLQLVTVITTARTAHDVAPEASGLLWVAEGDKGVRLYDTRNPMSIIVVTWISDLAPANALRLNGTKLFVGYGSKLSVLETLNPSKPRLISLLNLKDQFDHVDAINTLVVAGQRGYVGLSGSAAPDMITVDLSDLASMKVTGQIGTQGAGEHIAIHGNDVLIGSAQFGLQYIQIQGDILSSKQAWAVNEGSAPCADNLPSAPHPANGSEVDGDSVTLSWGIACAVTHYELTINSQTVTVNEPTYSLIPLTGHNTWQVVAVSADGVRNEGPIWAFDRVTQGWITAPVRISNAKMLYIPPLATVNLNDPKLAQPILCGALIFGIVLIVVVAWWLGQRADARRNRYL